jgi:hypothetical protein
MSAPVLILAGVVLLTGIALVILAVLITGIRRGDRDHLAYTPGSHSAAFARRLLVGVRYHSEFTEEDQ